MTFNKAFTHTANSGVGGTEACKRYGMWLVTVCCLLSGALEAAEVPSWKAGVASIKITPTENIWMSGYASRDHGAEGTRTDLKAKALALSDAEGHRSVLITLDLVGIHREVARSVCSVIMQAHGLQRSQIVINTSHTHTGPVVGNNLRTMYALSDEEGAKLDRYRVVLESNLVEVVNQAFENLAPAKLSYAEGQATFGTNRRNNPEAQVAELRAAGSLTGPVDYSVPVLRVADEQGNLRVLVFGYACHATTLGDYLWSGDYPGYAQLALEERHPGVTALFWAGCGADINPLPRRTPELATAYGDQLARAVNRALDGVLLELPPVFVSSYREIDLPFEQIPTQKQLEQDSKDSNRYVAGRAAALLAGVERGVPIAPAYPYPVGVWRLGNQLNWITLGGEVVVDYALRLKSESGGGHTWVAGYSHDVMAYMPSNRVWNEGGYEGGGAMVYYGLPSRWASGVEDRIIHEVRAQTSKLMDVSGPSVPK
jgi:neutral ceramidase